MNRRQARLDADDAGNVWIAIWDGWRVERWSPQGTLQRTIRLPVPRPTSVAFGGHDLATLYISTARVRLPTEALAEAPLSGALFEYTPDVCGTAVGLFAG